LINETYKWNSYFEIYNDSCYEKCYRFNGGKLPVLKSYAKGYEYGLQLEFLHLTNNLKTVSELIIDIHNNSRSPVTLWDKGDFISPG